MSFRVILKQLPYADTVEKMEALLPWNMNIEQVPMINGCLPCIWLNSANFNNLLNLFVSAPLFGVLHAEIILRIILFPHPVWRKQCKSETVK